MRVFLDANILFSAAWKDDADAALLFELAEAGYCQLTTSRLAVEEASRNIAAKRPADDHQGRFPIYVPHSICTIRRSPSATTSALS